MALDVLSPARAPISARRVPPAAAYAVGACVVLAVVLRILAGRLPAVVAAELAFVSLFAESLPFLLAGALLAHGLRSNPGRRLLAAATGRPRLAGALAPFAGLALPLCDCGLLPVARQLRARGSSRLVNGFLAGAPLTNPIVIVTTLLAFPGRPGMAVARVLCGLVVAAGAGALAPPPRAGCAVDGDHREHPGGDHDHNDDPGPGWLAAVGHEVARTGPALVVGAALAATLKAMIPTSTLTSVGHQPLLGAVALMALAFVMSICSQADAFVAAALPVGALPRLAFMVLGPVLDLRLAVLYRREFGGRWLAGYAAVVVPLVLVAVVVCTTVGLGT